METGMKWLTLMAMLWQSSKHSFTVEAAQRNGPECKLPANRGTCQKSLRRYFYDTQLGECRSFVYTGCGGNLNNFQTQEDCNVRCICLKSKLFGSGTESITRYFYNAESKQCESFQFRGIGGNTNNFINKKLCEDLCIDQVLKESCTLRPDYGRSCGKQSTQYYYDQNSNLCRQFKYGGCDGNDNRFRSPLECELVCQQIVTTTAAPLTEAPTTTVSTTSTTSTISPTTSTEAITTTATSTPSTSSTTTISTTTARNRPARCNLPRKRGNCNRRIPRFYFDVTTGRCGWFVYSGCRGNRNNFVRYRQCQRKCVNVKPRPTTTSTSSTTSSTTSSATTTPLPTTTTSTQSTTTLSSTSTSRSTTSSTTTMPTTTSSTTITPTTTSSTTTTPTTTSSTTTTTPITTSSTTTTTPTTTSSTATTTTAPSTTTAWFVPVRCLLQADQGPCDQINTRYYYDVNQNKCVVFIYSGCGGNGNNFFGLSECVRTCSKTTPSTSTTSTTTTTTSTTTVATTTTTNVPPPAQCRVPVSPGRCPFRLLRYYYDRASKTCKPFTYTGCFGNSNNFIQKAQCESTCNVNS